MIELVAFGSLDMKGIYLKKKKKRNSAENDPGVWSLELSREVTPSTEFKI